MNSESGRQFPAFEATSLNNKFKQLWLAGIQAKLVFETHAGHAWGSLHVCLGEHPGHQQQPPHPQEEPPCPPRHISPARQRRRERREAARTVTEAAATEAATAAEKKEDEAENATEPDNLSEVDEETANSNEGQVAAEEAETDHAAAVTETVSTENENALFVTDVDDEICSDEEYYMEIDPGEAFTCFQCKMEHYPDDHVEGVKVKMYGLCRWQLGVSRCKNCAKNLIGLGTIRVHRQICRAPS